MTVSAWLKTLNPLGIMFQDKTAADFERSTRRRADWPVHRWAECSHMARAEPDHSAAANKRGRPGGLAVPDYDPESEHAYAFEIAQHLCLEIAGENPKDGVTGRGSARKMDIWSKSIELLERAGL